MANNDDLILRGKALKDLRAIREMLVGAGDPFLASVMNRAIQCIENQPAVEAEPVVHAHWGEYEMFSIAPSLNGYPCSNCDHRVPPIMRGAVRCPLCGAHMDEEVPTNGKD